MIILIAQWLFDYALYKDKKSVLIKDLR